MKDTLSPNQKIRNALGQRQEELMVIDNIMSQNKKPPVFDLTPIYPESRDAELPYVTVMMERYSAAGIEVKIPEPDYRKYDSGVLRAIATEEAEEFLKSKELTELIEDSDESDEEFAERIDGEKEGIMHRFRLRYTAWKENRKIKKMNLKK